MALYRGRYRVESARLPDYDYASEGWYHVVLCIKGRAPWFGEVINGIMGLSSVGCIVVDEWLRTPHVRPYVVVDEWAVMPNHVHGILGLTVIGSKPVETPRRGVSTRGLAPRSLGAIIGQTKAACTKRIRAAGYPDFAWQPRFFDRVIRTERELNDTRSYIRDNPLTWETDRYHPDAPDDPPPPDSAIEL